MDEMVVRPVSGTIGKHNVVRHEPRARPLDSLWLGDLRRRLDTLVQGEMDMTVQVAVCLAAKMSKTRIVATLGCSVLDVQIAQQRLAMVVDDWSDE